MEFSTCDIEMYHNLYIYIHYLHILKYTKLLVFKFFYLDFPVLPEFVCKSVEEMQIWVIFLVLNIYC